MALHIDLFSTNNDEPLKTDSHFSSSGLVDLCRQLTDSFNLKLRKTVQVIFPMLVEWLMASFISLYDLIYTFFSFSLYS